MAKINTYEQRYTPTTQPSRVVSLGGEKRTPIYGPALDKKWEGISNLAENITHIGKKMAAARDTEVFMDTMETVGNNYDQLFDEMQSPEFRQTHKYEEYEEYFIDKAKKIQDKALSKLEVSSTARRNIESKIMSIDLDYKSKIRAYSRDSEISEMSAKIPIRLQNLTNKSLLADEKMDSKAAMDNINTGLAYIEGKIADGTISPEAGRAYRERFINGIQATRYERKIRIDPKGAVKELSKPSENLPEILREDLLNKALVAVERDELKEKQDASAYRYIVDDRIKNSIASISSTGVELPGIHEQIKFYYGDKAGPVLDQYNKAIAKAHQQHLAMVKMQKLPIKEGVEYIKESMPAPGSENYIFEKDKTGTLAQFHIDRLKALKEDRVGYVLSTGLSQEQYTEGMNNDDVRRITKSNIDIRISEQKRLGLGDNEVRVLTNAEAANKVDSLSRMTANEQADALEELETLYGSNWDKVYDDLVRAKLPSGIKFAATVEDASIRRELIRASWASDKDIKDGLGTDANNISKDIKIEIEEGIEDYFRTVSAQVDVGSIEEINELKDIMFKAAALRVIHQHLEPDEAAAQVVEELVNKKYGYGDTYRIQSEYKEHGRLIEMSMDNVIKRISDGEIILENPELNEFVENDGYWITNKKEDGYILVMNHPTPSIGVVKVTGADGQPVEIKMEDIIEHTYVSKEQEEAEAEAVERRYKYWDLGI